MKAQIIDCLGIKLGLSLDLGYVIILVAGDNVFKHCLMHEVTVTLWHPLNSSQSLFARCCHNQACSFLQSDCIMYMPCASERFMRLADHAALLMDCPTVHQSVDSARWMPVLSVDRLVH